MTRYPFHRYLKYLVLEGDDNQEIQNHLFDLGYVAPSTEDIEFLRETLVAGRLIDAAWRTACGVDMFDSDSADLAQAHWIVETGLVRECIERALVEKIGVRHTATIATLRFGKSVTEAAVRFFRDGWWDTESLTLIDFAEYLALVGKKKPDPPLGVPLHMRAAAAAWAEGILPPEEDLSTDDIMRALQVDAFMQYERARVSMSPEARDEARKWAALALRTSQLRKPKSSKRDQPELPGMKPAVYYPDYDAPSQAELEQPAEDEDDDPI